MKTLIYPAELVLFIVLVLTSCLGRKYNTAEEDSKNILKDSGKSFTKHLNVTYFCQYKNQQDSESSDGNSSLAMILNFFGRQILPNNIDTSKGKLTSLESIKFAAKHYELSATINRSAQISDMKKEVEANRPFILGADFGGTSGHFVVIIGYDNQGFFVNDPAGYWDESTFSPQAGYQKRGLCSEGVSGENRHYSYKAVIKAFDQGNGTDGQAWVVFFPPSPK